MLFISNNKKMKTALLSERFHPQSSPWWKEIFDVMIQMSRSVLFAEKPPQSMMFSPPCFTLRVMILG